MNTPKNTKVTAHSKSVQKFRDWVAKEIVRNNKVKKNRRIVKHPTFTFTVNKITNKIILNYYVPKIDISAKNKSKVKLVKKQKYLSNWSLFSYKDDGFSVLKWYEFVCDEVERYQTECYIDESSLEFWIKKYTSPLPRRGIKKIPAEKTRHNELCFLNDYLDWLKKNHPKYTNLWYHNDDAVREIVMEYLRFRATKSIHRDKGWSESTVFNSYRIIRSFLNWISLKEPNFKSNRLSNLPVEKPKPTLDTFTQLEFQKVVEFMEEYKKDNVWFWFIPILRVMLVSGCRISEVLNMKINELTFFSQNDKELIEWRFKGKGKKERVIIIDSSTCFSDIVNAISDDKDKIRTDKEFVFHKQFWKSGNNQFSNSSDGGFVEDIDEPYSISGVGHKFKKMVKLLKLNKKLSPHSTRRFFITQKLMESGGNIPFVALLVGHGSFEMVNHYQKHNQQSEMLLGMRNTLDFGEVIKRKKGIKYGKS